MRFASTTFSPPLRESPPNFSPFSDRLEAMAPVTCSICLEDLKAPVAIPCGHVHCKKCLDRCIRAGTDAMTANCPTCRAPFAIVTPDLEHIPEKYHQFIMSSIRRVYLDIDTNASEESEKERLEQQLALMDQQNRVFDKRVKTLQRDNYALADRCRTLENSSNIHAAGERHQRSDKERILTEMTELKKKYNNLKGKYKLLKDASSATSEQSRPKRKMTESPNLSVSPESSGVVGTSFAEHSRAMIPLPKRRRMDPGSELISCYGRPSVDPFTGLPSFVHIPISAPVMFPPPPIYVRRAQTPYRQPA